MQRVKRPTIKEGTYRFLKSSNGTSEVFWLLGVYEPIMENALKNQFQMSKNSKNKFSM
jgi:hypothetical protein